MRVLMLVAAVVLSAPGCSNVAVYVEHDPSANFGELARFGWFDKPSMAASSGPDGEILEARVRAVVRDELTARGLVEEAHGTPDFLVGFSAAVDNQLQAMTIDRYYGYTQSTYLTRAGTARDYPRETMGRQTVVQEYQQGTLVLDFSTPDPRRLIWRGYARSVIDPNSTQEQRDKRLREAVRKMLRDFPPR